MWAAFGGYAAIYGQLPTARKVRRVELYLSACNTYELEQQAANKAKEAEIERKLLAQKQSQH